MIFEPREERNWVVRKLRQIGDTHMKMAADIPSFGPEQIFDEAGTRYAAGARLEELPCMDAGSSPLPTPITNGLLG